MSFLLQYMCIYCRCTIPKIIIYKEMFLGCDWLIRVQLIPNITQNSAKICNKLFERWDLLAEKPKIWRPNLHVCLKISSKFQHNLEFFSDNYDHKTNSKVCWNFVHKIFSHGFYKHEFFKRRNLRMSALAKCEVVSTKCLFEHFLSILLISNSIISRAITENKHP